MSINVTQLRELVIQPILKGMPYIPYSETAVEMLLMIAAHESHMGTYLRQIGCREGIGAYGIYQQELQTIEDCFINYLNYREELKNYVLSFSSRSGTRLDIIANIPYQTALARVVLYRAPEKLPEFGDIEGAAFYLKKYWNTDKGRSTWEDYLDAYVKYCVIN